MEKSAVNSVTTLLAAANRGDPSAFSQIVLAVYADLHTLARQELAHRFPGQARSLTLCPTALVSGVVEGLLAQRMQLENREHFFAIATRLMRRLVIDYQRNRLAVKRGGGRRGTSLDETAAAPAGKEESEQDVLGALDALHELAPRKAEVVTLHVVCGFALPRVAELLEVSVPTVERDWRFARQWIAAHLNGAAG